MKAISKYSKSGKFLTVVIKRQHTRALGKYKAVTWDVDSFDVIDECVFNKKASAIDCMNYVAAKN